MRKSDQTAVAVFGITIVVGSVFLVGVGVFATIEVLRHFV